ncbi:hypothetical protein COLO4_06391 [Corchorus olitorius]|uniref:Uncharacterized protein n=1 Tax=Corchorus olitorius TaxID=93759 RepID=A0A1R3KN66_9ROSI|nr:hypothetical protein COLO4_06391 [Corchorus olitorius]
MAVGRVSVGFQPKINPTEHRPNCTLPRSISNRPHQLALETAPHEAILFGPVE